MGYGGRLATTLATCNAMRESLLGCSIQSRRGYSNLSRLLAHLRGARALLLAHALAFGRELRCARDETLGALRRTAATGVAHGIDLALCVRRAWLVSRFRQRRLADHLACGVDLLDWQF